MSWNSLPQELQLIILEFVADRTERDFENQLKFSPFATVCSFWQWFFETKTFWSLSLTQNDLWPFFNLVVGHRRKLVKRIKMKEAEKWPDHVKGIGLELALANKMDTRNPGEGCKKMHVKALKEALNNSPVINFAWEDVDMQPEPMSFLNGDDSSFTDGCLSCWEEYCLRYPWPLYRFPQDVMSRTLFDEKRVTRRLPILRIVDKLVIRFIRRNNVETPVVRWVLASLPRVGRVSRSFGQRTPRAQKNGKLVRWRRGSV
ncbi:hypothetical protein CDD81_6419 [Ophiocordyceps australis]|uniref:Uncharacterized protein n=1 Tax=Ophiocordyceps australis TaxID=1399860 RepID=A0A2C5Y7R0_9HYPO|nr:hypothetical protein CDD81_6419 [Ophiocordyceps australis]